jgi:hypothetical protein
LAHHVKGTRVCQAGYWRTSRHVSLCQANWCTRMATAVDSSFDSVDVSSQSESESAASFALDSEEEFLRVVDANVIHVEGGLDCCPATASCKNPVREDGRTRSHFHCPYVAKRPACPLVHGSRTRVADHVRSVHNDSAARARQRTKGTQPRIFGWCLSRAPCSSTGMPSSFAARVYWYCVSHCACTHRAVCVTSCVGSKRKGLCACCNGDVFSLQCAGVMH